MIVLKTAYRRVREIAVDLTKIQDRAQALASNDETLKTLARNAIQRVVVHNDRATAIYRRVAKKPEISIPFFRLDKPYFEIKATVCSADD